MTTTKQKIILNFQSIPITIKQLDILKTPTCLTVKNNENLSFVLRANFDDCDVKIFAHLYDKNYHKTESIINGISKVRKNRLISFTKLKLSCKQEGKYRIQFVGVKHGTTQIYAISHFIDINLVLQFDDEKLLWDKFASVMDNMNSVLDTNDINYFI